MLRSELLYTVVTTNSTFIQPLIQKAEDVLIEGYSSKCDSALTRKTATNQYISCSSGGALPNCRQTWSHRDRSPTKLLGLEEWRRGLMFPRSLLNVCSSTPLLTRRTCLICTLLQSMDTWEVRLKTHTKYFVRVHQAEWTSMLIHSF